MPTYVVKLDRVGNTPNKITCDVIIDVSSIGEANKLIIKMISSFFVMQEGEQVKFVKSSGFTQFVERYEFRISGDKNNEPYGKCDFILLPYYKFAVDYHSKHL